MKMEVTRSVLSFATQIITEKESHFIFAELNNILQHATIVLADFFGD